MKNSKIAKKLAFLTACAIVLPLVLGQSNLLESEDHKDIDKVNTALRENPMSVDYSLIDYNNPKLDYRLLDYSMADYNALDHNRVDSDKYFKDLGCNNCKLEKGPVNIKYSLEGLVHPESGLTRLAGLPPHPILKVTPSTIIIQLPSSEDAPSIDYRALGSGTLVMPDSGTTYSLYDSSSNQFIYIDGKISVRNGQIYVEQGDTAQFEDYKVTARSNDVAVFFDGRIHEGDYFSFEKDAIFAVGNGLKIEATLLDVKTKPQERDLNGRVYKPQEISDEIFRIRNSLLDENNPSLSVNNENDRLVFELGDLNDIGGRIKVSTVRNSLPLVETGGVVRIVDDDMPLRIADDKIFIELRGDKIFENAGSVPIVIVTENDKDTHYIFDESQNLFVTNKQDYEQMVQKRSELLDKFNLYLTGYFSLNELSIFENGLNSVEQQLGLNIKDIRQEVKRSNGLIAIYYPSVVEQDRRILKPDILAQVFETEIRWKYDDMHLSYEDRLKIDGDAARVIYTKISDAPSSDSNDAAKSDFSHEFGHVLAAASSTFDEDFKKLGQAYEIIVDQNDKDKQRLVSKESSIGNFLFPTTYSSKNYYEWNAELFNTMIERPQWFNDPYEGGYDWPTREWTRLEQPLSEDIMKKRQELKDFWLQELQKYKKQS